MGSFKLWALLAASTYLMPGAAFAQAASDAVAHAAKWPSAHSPSAITDAATERMITDLLARMTIEQKVGQLIQADISTIKPEDLQTYPLGSILAGGNSGPYGNERASAAEWSRLVGEFRKASLTPAANGVAVPILFGVDAVHGHSNLPNATIFPHNIGLGAAHDPGLIQRIGAATADEIAASGIEWTFAPTLASPQDLRWGRSYEGYSSDPKQIAENARAMVTGLQGSLRAGVPVGSHHVAATAKHFLADGGTFDGRDQGDARIDETTLIARHAAGYPAAIDAGALTVMVSFSSWNGVKNHGNRSLITDVLKDRMGFEGLVVGDWNGHGQVAGCTVTDCAASVNAGLDLYMAPDSWKGLYASLLAEAKSGAVPAARIDDAVRRILRVKAKLGLLGSKVERRLDPSRIGAPEHLALAQEAVAKSLVLLKNNGSVLPIKPGAKVLVAGPGADSIAMQAGGWTVSWQGSDVTNADFTNGQTIYGAIAEAVRGTGGKATLSADGSFVEKPDVAVVVFGEKPYAEFLGDVPTLAYQPGDQRDLAMLRKLKAAGVPVVSVFLSGRPMFVSPELNASDAFVAAWLPGTQGKGVADVLVAGKNGRPLRDFSGTLSFPWPADARSPVNAPLFDRGYGLTYAKPAAVPALSEDPRMDLAAAVDLNHLIVAGRAVGPWSMNLGDAAGGRVVMGATASSLGGKISMSTVDLSAQEDGRRFRWTGPASVSIDGAPGDFTRQLNNAFALRLDLAAYAVPGPVQLTFAGKSIDISRILRGMPPGKLATAKIPLRCFANVGATVNAVGTPLRIEAGAGTDLAIRSATIEAVGEPLPCE
ncbi:glycoside hydrolase family 3 protein [Sphingomonas flavescens]|uniref:glycoside hydrolase family 3 protein n=1 Tax=Sphingomonas flavescens TaxID=3132797 RepID=UPI0028041E46|nr:glycoside hydrolase family 3 N-terminal domain-containing protein [Sphingomonas limnosediminicola]